MNKRPIMLVEDNPDDEVLTLMALRDNNICNPIVVARDGQEALDYLFCTGPFYDRDPRAIPAIVLLDLKLPKIDGLEVLRRVRSYEATRLIPVVVLTSSKEEKDLISSYELGANSYIRKPRRFSSIYRGDPATGALLAGVESAPAGDRLTSVAYSSSHWHLSRYT